MVKIFTNTNDAGFELLKGLVVGRSIKHIELLTGTKYTKNHEDIDGIRIFLEDGTRIDITQDVDLFEGKTHNPLQIELDAEAK